MTRRAETNRTEPHALHHTPRRGAAAVVALLAALFVALGIGIFLLLQEPVSEEDRVRRTIGAVAAAAREADLGGTMEQVSPTYRDRSGSDYEAIWAFLFQQYRRRGPITVVLSPVDVLIEGEVATARFDAALADGIDLWSWELLPESADVIHFEVSLGLEEGEWRITGHDRAEY